MGPMDNSPDTTLRTIDDILRNNRSEKITAMKYFALLLVATCFVSVIGYPWRGQWYQGQQVPMMYPAGARYPQYPGTNQVWYPQQQQQMQQQIQQQMQQQPQQQQQQPRQQSFNQFPWMAFALGDGLDLGL